MGKIAGHPNARACPSSPGPGLVPCLVEPLNKQLKVFNLSSLYFSRRLPWAPRAPFASEVLALLNAAL